MKLQDCHITMLYHASSPNKSNAKPLEFVCNNMPYPSSAMDFDASNETTSTFTPPMVTKPLGDSITIVGTPTLSSNARHGGHASFIVISSISEDGGAKTTNHHQEISVPDFDEESDENVENLAPKKKHMKNYDLT